MDSELETYMHTDSFEAAAKQARWLAKLLNEQTGVARDGKSWAVLAPIGAREELSRPLSSGQNFDFDEDDERANMIADFSSDQDDWYRSEADGWFYED